MRIGAGRLLSAIGDWSAGPGPSLHRRLAGAVAVAIEAGLLPPGSLLPSERSLARHLAVGRSTVSAALAELKAAGLVEARQGSGTRVVDLRSAPDADLGAVVLPGLLGSRSGIDLAAAVPADARWLGALEIDPAELLACQPRHGYAPAGTPELRAAVAERHTARGLPTGPEQILITNGGHHGLALALRLLCRPGDAVLVDDPCYPGLVDLVAALGIRPVPVARPAGGVDAAALGRAVEVSGATVACLQPLVHNPSGTVAEEWELRRLAEQCDRLGLTVVEDLVLEDLRFDGDGPAPLAARLADPERVLSVGSLSKSVWGGLRVGWVRAGSGAVRRLVGRRLADDLGTSLPSQLVALASLRQLDTILAARRRTLAGRHRLLADLLAEQLPDWEPHPVAGGLSMWLTLPLPVAGPLAQAAVRHGVALATGASAGFAPAGHAHQLRLCFDRPEPLLTAAVERLVPVWRTVAGRARPGPAG